MKYPTRNDWVHTVKNDLKHLEINLDFEEIKKLSKESFSKIVRERTKSVAFNELMEKKMTHSKANKIRYTKLEMQSYMKNSKISQREAKNIFKFRTQMAREVKMNFRSIYTDLKCPECKASAIDPDVSKISDDTQEHLLYHIEIPSDCSIKQFYNKLFDGDDDTKVIVASLLQRVVERRHEENVD